MDGVKILSVSTEIPYLINSVCLSVAVTLGYIYVTLGCIYYCLKCKQWWSRLIICIIAFLTVTFIFVIGMCDTETTMKATIEPSVSLTEFNKKYEIISQDDYLYTIKEREK